MERAIGVMLKGTSDLGSVWMSSWHGHGRTTVASRSRGWQEALIVQSAAASVQRISSTTTESAEVTRDVARNTFRPLQERVHTAARFSLDGGKVRGAGSALRTTAS
jgi:hypothetical protein